jgi:hypothetical protein
MIKKSDLERMWDEVAVLWFKVISQRLRGTNEGKNCDI